MKFIYLIPAILLSLSIPKYSYSEKIAQFDIILEVHSTPCNVKVNDVVFGTLSSDDVNGLQYRRKLEITPGCDPSATKFILKFDGPVTASGLGMLATYDEQGKLRDDFGIRFEDDSAKQLNIRKFHEYPVAVLPDIYVRPYTRETTPLKTGSFNAQATISIWYE